ncbi:hypothetical protein ACFQV2_01980 [Actinokineospora soli]|uniref:Dual OB-containing domain-containing protein n=1 Tax=Actinokineospora soli TaxID=1048753 RepID=A0ABW2TJ44_9PSEU
MTKRFVCLANSRKHSGRCVAGIELGTGRWVRPISDRAGRELSILERRCPDGTEPALLDVIDVPVVGHQPDGVHRENWLIETGAPWRRPGRMAWGGARTFSRDAGPLWANGHQTSGGVNDVVPADELDVAGGTLRLVHVDAVTVEVARAPYRANDRRPTVRVRFEHAGDEYAFKLTDPLQETRFREAGIGSHVLGESLLTVSLSEEFDDRFYKLVAAIIERATARPRNRP